MAGMIIKDRNEGKGGERGKKNNEPLCPSESGELSRFFSPLPFCSISRRLPSMSAA